MSKSMCGNPKVRASLLLGEHPVDKVGRLQIKRWYAKKPRKRADQKAGKITNLNAEEAAYLREFGLLDSAPIMQDIELARLGIK